MKRPTAYGMIRLLGSAWGLLGVCLGSAWGLLGVCLGLLGAHWAPSIHQRKRRVHLPVGDSREERAEGLRLVPHHLAMLGARARE